MMGAACTNSDELAERLKFLQNGEQSFFLSSKTRQTFMNVILVDKISHDRRWKLVVYQIKILQIVKKKFVTEILSLVRG